MNLIPRALALLAACTLLAAFTLLRSPDLKAAPVHPRLGERSGHTGQEIVVCGQFYYAGTTVVTWMDPGGYDAYRIDPRPAPAAAMGDDPATGGTGGNEQKRPSFGVRIKEGLAPANLEVIRAGRWTLPLLQQVVDQFVLHYDQSGTSRRCFRTLTDRCLSVHFMLDLDGTIYQTLDLKERAWHATTSNTRSIGIEIANRGAYATPDNPALTQSYARDADGRTRIKLPPDHGVRTPGFIARPSSDAPIAGRIQGEDFVQYDFTPQQYESLIKLTATLCQIFPELRCDFPRDAAGLLIREKLPNVELNKYRGLLGHYHVQANKYDPGPAIQWERVVKEARGLMGR